MTDDEIVYLASNGDGGTSKQTYHLDRDCPRLDHARKIFDYRRSRFPDADVCQWCDGTVDRYAGGNDGLWQTLGEADPGDLITDGGQCSGGTEQIRVAVPRADSQAECYHAPGGPCGSHLLRNVETTVGELREAGLYPCTNCMENHGLPAPNGGESE